MEFEKYIGYRFEVIKTILDEKNIDYGIIEVFDTKMKKIGNDLRVINVKEENQRIIVYVSYF